MVAIALSIAGSDPSGGAGIQADLKTFHAFGVYGEAVVSLLTVQNSLGVSRVEPISSELVLAQMAALWDDMPPDAVKTGALPSDHAVRAIADVFRGRRCPLVVDPILAPTAGARFSRGDLVAAYREALIPVCALVTPNALEAATLCGFEVADVNAAERAARSLVALGAGAALVKGGHLSGAPVDVLYVSGQEHPTRIVCPRVDTHHTHGTGCTYAAAITAGLALGRELETAVREARAYLQRALSTPLHLGRGQGPVNHFAPEAKTSS